MNTASHNQTQLLAQRKKRHHEICVNNAEKIHTTSSAFDQITIVHNALPELHFQDISTESSFINHTISLPLFISCMTGGSAEGFRANRHFALAAQHMGIPVGMGSVRILLSEPDLFEHFHLKKWAPDVPVIANIGAVQLKDLDVKQFVELLKKLEVQYLAIHCNVGQELFQDEGDRDFSNIITAIASFCTISPIPVIVKETGFGFTPKLVSQLLENGATAIDVAGAGGTNWIAVEALRNDCNPSGVAENFSHWGIPTALNVAALHDSDGTILASGGIRTARDIACSLALGAQAAGMALPFLQAEKAGHVDALCILIESLRTDLKKIQLLSGSQTISSLRKVPLILSDSLISKVKQYRLNGDWRKELP